MGPTSRELLPQKRQVVTRRPRIPPEEELFVPPLLGGCCPPPPLPPGRLVLAIGYAFLTWLATTVALPPWLTSYNKPNVASAAVPAKQVVSIRLRLPWLQLVYLSARSSPVFRQAVVY